MPRPGGAGGRGACVQAVCIPGVCCVPFDRQIRTEVEVQDSVGEVGWFPSGCCDTNTQMSTAPHGRALRTQVSAKVDVAQTMAIIPLGGLLSEPMQPPQGKEPPLPQLAHFT